MGAHHVASSRRNTLAEVRGELKLSTQEWLAAVEARAPFIQEDGSILIRGTEGWRHRERIREIARMSLISY